MRFLLPFLSLFCTLSPSAAFATDPLTGPIPAIVERVIDGDTLVVRARIWLDQDLTIKVRLANVNAPELSRPQCQGEKRHAEVAKSLIETLIGPGKITLHNIHYGKYAGRIVADVHAGDHDLATSLKLHKLDGKTWCSRQ